MGLRVQIVALMAALAAFLLDGNPVAAEQKASQTTVLFQNVRIFDGRSGVLSEPSNVLVTGNTIEKISTDPISNDRNADVITISGGGRTLMPGLIDAHWHAMLVRPNPVQALASDLGISICLLVPRPQPR
jgi:imidazolonepropionase-like amidohydrolase